MRIGHEVVNLNLHNVPWKILICCPAMKVEFTPTSTGFTTQTQQTHSDTKTVVIRTVETKVDFNAWSFITATCKAMLQLAHLTTLFN